MNYEEITAKIVELLKKQDSHFLELASALRHLHDQTLRETGSLDNYKEFLKQKKVGERTAAYLVDIDRVYPPLNVERDRLVDLGWTKLALLSPHVTFANIEELLEAAKGRTAEELKAYLAGMPGPAVTLTFKLSEAQAPVILAALQKHGAIRMGRNSYAHKEAALTAICASLG